MPNLELVLPPNRSPILSLFTRADLTPITPTIPGTAGPTANRYVFDLTGVATGDYVADISDPPGGFMLRLSSTDARIARQWWELDAGDEVGTGTGAYVVTVTAEDADGQPIQGALVRLYRPGASVSNTTNANGHASVSVDSGNWTVSITAGGFEFTPTPLAVSGDASVTYTLTISGSVAPSPVGQTTGYWTVFNKNGEIYPGAAVVLEIAQLPKSNRGLALSAGVRNGVADADGVVAFAGLFPGATYRVTVDGSRKPHQVQVPLDAGSSVPLGSIWG